MSHQIKQPLDPNPVIEAYKKDVDRTLIRENLKLTPEQRVLKLMEMQRFAQELRKAGRRLHGESVCNHEVGRFFTGFGVAQDR